METEPNTTTTPTMKELIMASAGYNDEIQAPNASCILYLDVFHMDGAKPTPISQMSIVTPTVNIFRHAETSMVTLTFPTKFERELASVYNMLEAFGDASQSMEDESDFPLLRLVIIPNKYAGKYYIVAANPLLWSLCPAGLDGEPRVIRFAVSDENLVAYEGEEDGESEAETNTDTES